MEIFHISLLTVRQTLTVIGLSTQSRSISEEQAQRFALARWLLEVEGKTLAQVRESFHSEVELDSRFDVNQVAQAILDAKQGLSIADLAVEFGIGVSTVRRTLAKIGLEHRRYLNAEDVSRFAWARQLYATGCELADDTEPEWREGGQQEYFRFTKQQLAKRYGLSLLTVRKTLAAAGISTRRRHYLELEVERFDLARSLLEQGYQYREVADRLHAETISACD